MLAERVADPGPPVRQRGGGARRRRLHRRDDRSLRARRARKALRHLRHHDMNLFKYFLGEVKLEVARMARAGELPAGLDLERIAVEPTRDPAHGDISTNAAMVLAKPAGKNPRALAVLLADALRGHAAVTAAEVAGPRVLNLPPRENISPPPPPPTPPLRRAPRHSHKRWRGHVNVRARSAHP